MDTRKIYRWLEWDEAWYPHKLRRQVTDLCVEVDRLNAVIRTLEAPRD